LISVNAHLDPGVIPGFCMRSADLQTLLAIHLQDTRRTFCEFLLRDLDRTMRHLEMCHLGKAPVSDKPDAMTREYVEEGWRMLEEIERCLMTFDLESSQQEALRERRVALTERLQLLGLCGRYGLSN
jgi:hypothetical protein